MSPVVNAPAAVAISPDLGTIEISSTNGVQLRLAAAQLRSACKCAHCTRARIDGRFPSEFPGVTIVDFKWMGSYAINISFSDGHDRGIYPWQFLYRLADP